MSEQMPRTKQEPVRELKDSHKPHPPLSKKSPRLADRDKARLQRFLSFVVWGALLGIIACLEEFGLHPAIAIPLGALLGALAGLAVFLAFALRHKWFRIICWRIIEFLRRERERYDFNVARRVANSPGRTFQIELISVWTDMSSDLDHLESELDVIVHRSLRSFAALTGFSERIVRPVRLICFEREADFLSYARILWPDVERIGGYYSGFLCKRIVTSGENANRLPHDFRSLVAHELSHHFLRSNTKWWRPKPTWLEEGIACVVQRDVGGHLHEAGAHLRLLNAERSRGKLFSGRELVSVDPTSIHDGMEHWSDLDSMYYVYRFYFQSALFCRFLAAADSEGFGNLVLSGYRLHYVKGIEKVFDRFFDKSPDELMADCLSQYFDTPLPAYQRPSDWLQQRIDAELVAPMLNRETPIDERILAIRSMGSLGYPWRADALIRVLDDPNKALRAEASHALGNIAGKASEPKSSNWNEWFRALPHPVTACHHVD